MEPSTSTPLKFRNDYFEMKNFTTNLMCDEEDSGGDEGYVDANNNSNNTQVNNVLSSCNERDSKGTRFLSAKAVQLLNKWFMENKNYPYPDESATELLANQAEISAKQVKKWFANKRVRSQLCCKTINRNKKKFKSEIHDQNIKQEEYLTHNSSDKLPESLSSNFPSSSTSLSPLSGSYVSMSSPSPPQTFLVNNNKSSLQNISNKNRRFLKKTSKSNIKQTNVDKGFSFDKHSSWPSFNSTKKFKMLESDMNMHSNTDLTDPKMNSYFGSKTGSLNQHPSILKSFSINPTMIMNFLAATSSASLSPPSNPSSSSCSYSSLSNSDSSPSLSGESSSASNVKSQSIQLKSKDINKKYPNGLLENQEERQSFHSNDTAQISQNNKNYSNFLMLMMMSKYSCSSNFNFNNYNNQCKELLSRNKNSPLSASPSSFLSNSSPLSATCEMRNSSIQNCQEKNIQNSNKTNFAVISTLID